MSQMAIVVDLNRCVGCQTCTAACKHMNATAPGVQWRKVLDFEQGEYPEVRRAFLPVGCMHCDQPPCLEVCPSGATGKHHTGTVTIDYQRCIGCTYCAVACPYQARFRVDEPAQAYSGGPMRHETKREDPARIGVAQKCTLCLKMVEAGIKAGLVPGEDPAATPACVNSCISGALHFGDREDPNGSVARLLRENRHFRMHEELGTGPNIFYLYERGAGGASNQTPKMLPDAIGQAGVAPKLQTHWDWRAAVNFMFGGTGSGLILMLALLGLTGISGGAAAGIWGGLLLGLGMVALGLGCVLLEIGRVFRFANVFYNPRRSWMSREAYASLALFGFGVAAWVLSSMILVQITAAAALIFLYAQGRILRAAKGIPAWRHPAITGLIVATGLTEGISLLGLLGFFWAGGISGPAVQLLSLGLLVLITLRWLLWRRYRRGLGKIGAPTASFAALDGAPLSLSIYCQLAAFILVATGLIVPPVFGIGAALALASGWGFKFNLITKAAFTQGYAIPHMPARGMGTSSQGIKPGWSLS